MPFHGSARLVKAIQFAACLALGGACGSCAVPGPPQVASELQPAGATDSGGHVSAEEIARGWARIDRNLARIGPLPAAKAGVKLRWPLRAARGLAAEGLHYQGDFPDHNPGTGALDYNCGTRSNDRADHVHHGADFYSWAGHSWTLMARDQLEVVAAAGGTVVDKVDGMFDRNCAGYTGEGQRGNYLCLRHDDGTFAYYVHLKASSLTSKDVGERVEQGEYVGILGSSGSSGRPHLHFEAWDAERRFYDPYQGPCNDWIAESWWEAQRPYYDPGLNRVMTLSAPDTPAVCGADGRVADPGAMPSATSFKPGDQLYTLMLVRDIRPGDPARLSIRKPDGTFYSDYEWNVGSTAFINWSAWRSAFTLHSAVPLGTWMVEASVAGAAASTSFQVTADGSPAGNYTDLWWNRDESGWGVNVNHQGDVLFATWFTYDADGSPMWLVMSDARLQADGSFSGAIHRTTGVPFWQIDGRPAADFPPAAVGTASFRFHSQSQGVFSYTVGSVSQQKSIERQRFSTPATCRATKGPRAKLTNYQDLWWNPAEPGWGINLAHQGDIVFATWFTYGADGRGLWLVGSEVRRQPTGEFRGRLLRTRGVAFDRIRGAPALASYVDVGELVLRFTSGEAGTMTYTVDGITQTKSLERQVFRELVNHCE